MDTGKYELLKCLNCGKTLGYIRLDVKVYPPKTLIHLTAGGPVINVEKDAYCEECFRRLTEKRGHD
jgi:hypothetical protein